MATYAIMLARGGSEIVAMKASSNPSVDANWSNQGGSVVLAQRGHINPVKSMWVYEDGSDLHVATQQLNGRVAYHVFDPGTDTWTTSDEFVVTNNPNVGFEACSIALRSDGDVIIGYSGNDAGDDAIFYARKEGASWTTNVQVDGSASTNNYRGPVVVLGASDRVHFFYRNVSNVALSSLHRSLSSANSLDTADQVIDTTVGGVSFIFAHGVSYVSGATKIRVLYLDFDDTISVVKLDSGADPTISTDTGVGDAATEIIDLAFFVMCAVLSRFDMTCLTFIKMCI